MSHGPVERAIGLMIGTSLDGIDAARVAFAPDGFELEAFATSGLRDVDPGRLREIASGAPTTAAELSALAFALAREHARAIQAVDPERRADLVGAHGVTLAHVPDRGHGWQLLSGAALAARCARDVACDFRRADIALGGQGAPLAPLVDLRLRTAGDEDRIVLNLGGIANYAALPAGGTGPAGVLASDAGPANLVLDGWMRRLSQGAQLYDAGGALARSGTADEGLATRLLSDPWFALPRPRSAGREEFGEAWLDRCLEQGGAALPTADLMATLVQVCVRAVADQIHGLPADWRRTERLRVLVTGGGRHNLAVLEELRARLAPATVEPIEAIGENGDAKEAVDFAWLALARRHHRRVGIAAVTGARCDLVAGALHLGAREAD